MEKDRSYNVVPCIFCFQKLRHNFPYERDWEQEKDEAGGSGVHA